MNVIDLKKFAGEEEFDTIVEQYRFKPFWWVRQIDSASQSRLMRRHLEQMRETATAVILGAYSQHDLELCGFVTLSPLVWDSEHFGVSVWRVGHLGVWGDLALQRETACALVHSLVSRAYSVGAQTLFVWIPLDAICVIHALESVGFHVMESQVYWAFDLKGQTLPLPKTDAVYRAHTLADTESLVALARRMYTHIPDRFHADPQFPVAASDELYARWLYNSCTGEAADHILVLDVNGRVAGYSTMRFLDDQAGLCNIRMGQLLLGAIEPEFRQKGLYDDLLRSSLLWLQSVQADLAFVGTQSNNIMAQMGMARSGWRPVCGGLSLHFWQS